VSVRETILNNFATALAGITTDDGYESDVELVPASRTAVERNVVHPDDLATGMDKVRIVLEDPESSTSISAFAGVKRLCTMTATVRAYVSGPRQSGPQTPAGKIIADVAKLCDSPVSLGSNGRFARVVSENVELTGDKSAVVIIPVEIVYWYAVSAP
jgi:hypothetical protein